MASSTPITVEDTIMAVLEANLDANQSFTNAALGKTAAQLSYLRGEQYSVTKTPVLMVSCNRWRISGNPNAMGGSVDRALCQIVGLLQYADKGDQEKKIRHFAWAVKEVLEGEGSAITDTATGSEIYGSVASISFENLLAMSLVEGDEDRMFRSFTLIYEFQIPQNV